MKAITIRFNDGLYDKLNDYSMASGESIQSFVAKSAQEKLDRIELEQELKDQEYLNK